MHQQAELDWTDSGVPIARAFDDPYFSLSGGLEETRHVFLAGNDLPRRFRPGFHVAELGFGTGLNFLATLDAFRRADIDGRLCFTSFEAHPMTTQDLRRALAGFEDLPRDVLQDAPGNSLPSQINGDDFDLSIIFGDARETLPVWTGLADAWFLDGFSPAKNPAMWEPDLLRAVAAHTAPSGTFATYTAAGHVRRGLEAAGFDVSRTQGYGRKRHMSRGILT